MKLKINLKSCNSNKKYHTVIEIKEEIRIAKENNDTLIIIGIKDLILSK